MSNPVFAPKLVVLLVAAASIGACSAQSPVAPSATAVAGAQHAAKASGGVPGVYDLSFNVWVDGTYQEVSSLPVAGSTGSRELILKGYVADNLGRPATKGSITFQYCSYKSGPANDIARPDEAPKEACADGTATWARLATRTVSEGSCPRLGMGYACVNFGMVQIPRTVGFRIRYEPQGSGIASGMTEPENFTWVAGS